MSQRFFHTTDAATSILLGGFRGEGVFLANFPANVSDGASGNQVLEVLMPDDVDLSPYAVREEGHQDWEWVVPAFLVNDLASLRLLSQDEVDAASAPESLMGQWLARDLFDVLPDPEKD